MKQYLYSLKNRLSGIFERPVAEIYDISEYPDYLAQSLALADEATLTRYKEFDVYCLGILDNKSGEIKPCVEFMFSLEPLCTGYLGGKKVLASDALHTASLAATKVEETDDGKREETGA